MWEWLVPVLAGSSLWGIWQLRWRSRLQLWARAAEMCGLQEEQTFGILAWRLKSGPLEVRFEDRLSLKGETRAVIVVPGPPGFSEVRIRREPRLFEAREIEIGDETFDRTFFLEGPRKLVLALLDEETRKLLLRVNQESWLEISGGEIRAQMVDDRLPLLLPDLLEAARRLAQPLDVARQLAWNANRDAVQGVRLLSLLFLVREHPGEPETVEALRKACSDPSPEIRLRAARELGRESRDVLLELAESLMEDTLSAQAVSILKRELSFDLAKTILEQSLRKRRHQTARACLEALGHSGDDAAVDLLAKVLARERGKLADAAAEALEKTGSPAAEAPLIRALERERPEVRVAAAKALGRIGSPAAVLPLKDAAERFPDRELRQATRQAIAEIQARLPGATPGQLSLAGAEGQLSLAGAEAGQLSLASEPAGQVSLSEDGEEPEPGRLV